MNNSGLNNPINPGLPNYAAGIAVNALTYTAPDDGILTLSTAHADGGWNGLTINGIEIFLVAMNGSYASGYESPTSWIVQKGDYVVSKMYNILNFYPFK